MLPGCTASRGEESLITAQAVFQSTALSSIGSYCFPLAKPYSRTGISLQTFPFFVPF